MPEDTKKLLAAAKAGKLEKILTLAGFDLEGEAVAHRNPDRLTGTNHLELLAGTHRGTHRPRA